MIKEKGAKPPLKMEPLLVRKGYAPHIYLRLSDLSQLVEQIILTGILGGRFWPYQSVNEHFVHVFNGDDREIL